MVTGQDQPITVKEGQFKLSLRPVEGQGAEIFIPKGGSDPKGAGLLLDSRDRKIQGARSHLHQATIRAQRLLIEASAMAIARKNHHGRGAPSKQLKKAGTLPGKQAPSLPAMALRKHLNRRNHNTQGRGLPKALQKPCPLGLAEHVLIRRIIWEVALFPRRIKGVRWNEASSEAPRVQKDHLDLLTLGAKGFVVVETFPAPEHAIGWGMPEAMEKFLSL